MSVHRLKSAGRNDDDNLPLDKVYANYDASEKAKCCEVLDDSNAPQVIRGDRVFFEPDVKPEPGGFVMARIRATGEEVIRKYREVFNEQRGAKSFELYTIDRDFARIPGEQVEIMGTAVSLNRRL